MRAGDGDGTVCLVSGSCLHENVSVVREDADLQQLKADI